MSHVDDLYTGLGFISHEMEQMNVVHRKQKQVAKKAFWLLVKQFFWPPFRRKHPTSIHNFFRYTTQGQCSLQNYMDFWERHANKEAMFDHGERVTLVDLRIDAEVNFDRALTTFELMGRISE